MKQRNSLSQSSKFFRGTCTTAEEVGKIVYINGDPSGELYPVRTASSSDSAKVPGIGVVIKKYSDTDCLVQMSGEVRNIFTGLEINKTYKLDHDGGIRRLIPDVGPGGYAYVQFIGTAISSNTLWLNIEHDMKKRVS